MRMVKSTTAAILVIPILFLCTGLLYIYYTPLWNPPDEERHFIYCEYIAHNHRLPAYRTDPQGNIVSMAFHPPLYYLIGSLFFRNDQGLLEEEILINDGPGYNLIKHPQGEAKFPYTGKARIAYLLRLFSLVLGGITICIIYLIAITFLPGDTTFASATAIFVATIPQFLHLSSSISNENLSTTLSAGYLLSLMLVIKEPHKLRWHIGSGILLGLCLLSKTLTLFYLPVTVCLILWISPRDRRSPFLPLSVILGIGAVVGGWWYLRNWLFYNDPMLSKTVGILNPWHLQRIPISLGYVTTVIQKTFSSFFGEFGALQFSIPSFHLAFYGGILFLGITGLCQLSVIKGFTPVQRRLLGIFSLFLLGGVGVYVYLNTQYSGFFLGRYLFLVLAPIAVLTFVGLQTLFPHQWRNPLFICFSLVLILLNLNVLFRVVQPAYAETLLVEAVNQPMFCCPTPELSGNTTLSQTFIAPGNNLAAIRVMFSCPVKELKGQITFALKDTSDPARILHQMHYPLKEINDSDRCCFIFPPIPNSKGKEYVFTFNSPSLPPGKGIALWYNTDNRAAEGSMLIDGKLASGNLYFQAYCFSGERPATDWQGRRETVINQGWYLSLREIQLSSERTQRFSEKTITRQKFQLITKALLNRSLSPR